MNGFCVSALSLWARRRVYPSTSLRMTSLCDIYYLDSADQFVGVWAFSQERIDPQEAVWGSRVAENGMREGAKTRKSIKMIKIEDLEIKRKTLVRLFSSSHALC